jgi:ribosomal protein L11 methyltransferase
VETLRRLGARSVERWGEQARALFPDPGELGPFLDEVRAALQASIPSKGSSRSAGSSLDSALDWALDWAWESHADWTRRWRDAHPPRRVGRRFQVMAVGEEDESRSGDDGDGGDPGVGTDRREVGVGAPRIPLLLTPGVGFGTGEHPTTRACLALLEDEVGPGDRIADVGSGSGILAVAAALLGAASVEAFEVDPVSTALARANVQANRVGDKVTIQTLRVEAGTPLPRAPFHGIVANLESPILLPLLPTLVGALSPGGWLLTSGTLAPERTLLVRHGETLGLGLRTGVWEEGWWSAVFSLSRERRATEGG